MLITGENSHEISLSHAHGTTMIATPRKQGRRRISALVSLFFFFDRAGRSERSILYDEAVAAAVVKVPASKNSESVLRPGDGALSFDML